MISISRIAVLALLTAAAPIAASAQQPAPAPKATKASAQKVVDIVSADKAKAKSYCELGALGEQLEAATAKKDAKSTEALSQKVNQLESQIGPEYVALMDGLENVDPDTKEAKEIAGVLDVLDKLCDAK